MDELLIISVCLLLNALFSSFEMAFVTVTRSGLKNASKKGNKAATQLLLMRDNPERTLSIIQIGITLVGAVAAAIGGSGAAENLEPYLISQFNMSTFSAGILSVIVVVLPITYLSVVIGELVPKSLALRAPMKIALGGAKAIAIADKFLAPVITVLEWSTKLLLKTFFKKGKASLDHKSPTTVEIDELSPLHQSFVMNMVQIEKRKMKDIMVPWEEVNSVANTATILDVTQAVLRSGHTRLPVSSNGEVVGVLHTKEFVALKESGETNWQSIIRPVLRVLPTDSALGTLRLMQEKRSHMTVVFSPQGERLGIVTLEDILEEIVGDIYDEDDDGKVRKVFARRIKARLL